MVDNSRHRSFSLMGSVALVNFPKSFSDKEKKRFAKDLLERNKSVKTVLEKSHKFSGRLRKMKVRHLAGERTTEVLYKENGCEFRFDVEDTYFSPRLSNERKEIAGEIKAGEEVLVLFAGVSPFSIVIAKNSPAKIVYSNELNRKANEYAKENIIRNKVQDKVVLVPGDAKKVASKLASEGKSFDVIVMPRPQLKETFLKDAFKLAKDGTRIYYYGFCLVEEKDKIVEQIKSEAKEVGLDVNILRVKPAGEIGPGKIRLRVDFVVRKKKAGFWKRIFGKGL